MKDLSDKEIWIGTEEQVLKNLYDRYYVRLCFYAGKYVHCQEEAEDIVQDIFVNLWEKRSHFPNETALNAFLYMSVYNACLNCIAADDRHRKHHEKIRKLSSETDNWDYIQGRIEEDVMWKIFSTIDTLPEECGKVFKMSYLEGMDLKQVAETLDITVHTVKSQRARAKKLLQERLQDLFLWCIPIFFS